MTTCNPLTPDSYKVLVQVPLVSPYAFQWILGNDPRDDIGDSIEFVKAPATLPASAAGAVIHFGTNRLGQNPPFGKPHHVSIEVDGELMSPADGPDLEPPQVQSTGNRSSLLKARITLAMGTARERDFDFDIGAGVEFDVFCYAVQKIEILIPDPRVDIPGEPAPLPAGTILAPQQLSTVITSTVYFTARTTQGSAFPLSYTVPFTVAGNALFIPRVPDSRWIEVIASDLIGGAGSVIVDFLYVPEGLPDATYTEPAAYFVVGSATMPAGSTVTNQVIIPGNANAFRVRAVGDAAVGSLVQILGAM